MEFNKEKIISNLNILSERIKSSNSLALIDQLKNDYQMLLMILKHLDNNAYENYLNSEFLFGEKIKSYTSDFQQNSFEALNRNKNTLISMARDIESYQYFRPHFSFGYHIPQQESIAMTEEFFRQYDYEQFIRFKKLEEDSIHFIKDKKLGFRGLCYPMFLTKESYLLIDYKKGQNLSTLPHEVAHAYEFSLIQDFSQYLNWFLSTFVEAYPKFIELLFLETYSNGKYSDIILKHLVHFFGELKMSLDYNLSYICDFRGYDASTNNLELSSGKLLSKQQIDLICSDLFAVYMLHLYKTDIKAFKEFLAEYQRCLGCSDDLIWSLASKSDLRKALFYETKTLNKEAILSRKKANQGLLNIFK